MLIVTLLSAFLFSQINAQTAVEKFEQEAIYLSNTKYVKNGQKYPLGFFSGNLKKEMTISPAAMAEWGQHEKSRNKFLVFYGVGVASLITALVIDDDQEALKTGFLVGSLAAITVSIPFANKSEKSYQKAIWLRNRDILR